MTIIRVRPLVCGDEKIIQGARYGTFDVFRKHGFDVPKTWSYPKKAKHDPMVSAFSQAPCTWMTLHIIKIIGLPGTRVSPAYQWTKTWRRIPEFPYFLMLRPLSAYSAFRSYVTIGDDGVAFFGMRRGPGDMKISILSSQKIKRFMVARSDIEMGNDYCLKNYDQLVVPGNELPLF